MDEDGIEEMVVGSGCKCGGSATPIPVVQIVEWNGSAYNISWTSEPFPQGGGPYGKETKVFVDAGQLLKGPAEEIVAGTHYPNPATLRVYSKAAKSYECIWEESITDEDINALEIGDYNNDGRNEMIISTTKKVRIYEVTVEEEKPYVFIKTDKTEYFTGDIMIVNITIGNPTNTTQNVVFNWWITIPSKNFYTAPLSVVPMSIPPGYNVTFSYPITVGYWGADSFGAVFCVALTNQTTNKIISFDATFWNYNPTTRKKKVSVESIVEKIRRAIR